MHKIGGVEHEKVFQQLYRFSYCRTWTGQHKLHGFKGWVVRQNQLYAAWKTYTSACNNSLCRSHVFMSYSFFYIRKHRFICCSSSYACATHPIYSTLLLSGERRSKALYSLWRSMPKNQRCLLIWRIVWTLLPKLYRML